MNTAGLPSVDVAGILERAGADEHAVPGTQAWALAQVQQRYFAALAVIEALRSSLTEMATVADEAATALAGKP